jgi:dolichyl-phosphate-mannose-protein mannosyltransferase
VDAEGRMRKRLFAGLGVALALAAVKLAIHVATTGRWGYELFVDELYFLDCARHLDWGYVDMPPLFPAATAVVVKIFGETLFTIRAVAALAGAALVLLTCLLARELGGGRFAQALAGVSVIAAPLFLIGYSLHTMNELEPLFVAGCALLLARIANGGDPRLWLLFGALVGLGLLNKHSMAVFGAALAAGLVATPLRRAFRERWIWLAGSLALLLFLPNLVWVVGHRFPHLEMLANVRRSGRDVALSLPAFLLQHSLAMMGPLAALVFVPGLLWLLFAADGRRFRALGVAALVAVAVFAATSRRVYYPAPIYPALLAAGGVATERWVRSRGARATLMALVAAEGVVLAPLAFPCVPPETYPRYARALRIAPPAIETHRLGPLPQLLADRFGWREMAEEVARIFRTRTPEERAKAAIFGQNYGQAGAVNHYGPELGLPRAISGHLTHWYWGPQGRTGEVAIVMDDDQPTLERYWEDVRLAGHVSHPYSMPYEHFDVFVCRKPRPGFTFERLWPALKKWD